ncbi:MAG TPA: NAD-dependent epimerase/dehydratase family protein [bacterium]|nr:NAD-dependent epimerase/dehydratase family protein [bacterium]
MNVLITGGGGFLGGALTHALLARGDAVTAFDAHLGALELAAPKHPRLILAPGDITDLANVAQVMLAARPDAVIHAAAIVGVVNSLGSPITVMRVNVEGALNVFEAMRLAGTRRVLHISSEETYGPFQADLIDETHPQHPVLPYGISKLTVEHLGRTYRDLHGLEVINLRTTWVFGPGLPRNRIPKNLLDAALAGQALHLPNGADTAIDHTYVDDFVAGTLLALDLPSHPFDAYHIASGHSATVADLVRHVRELVPGADLSVGPGAFRFNDQVALVRKGALSIERARKTFGYVPAYDIRRGLAAYLQARRAAQTAGAARSSPEN